MGRVTGLVSPVTASASGAPTTADLQQLDASLSGSVVLPGSSSYLSALQLFDPIYDVERPLAVVQPANASDVATTVRFASGYTTPFAPRAGGHSYVGASGGDQGLQLDLRRLHAITYNTTTHNVAVGGGATLYSVHTALESFGRTIPTGTCATAGISGLTLGGGVGFESRAYGLTCDALRSVQVVLANGTTVTASPSQNADLFWACRGGGGGNFGVVTKYTFATSPATSVGFATLRWTDADTEAAIAGWQQRVAAAPASTTPVLHLTTTSGQVTPSIVVFALGTTATAEVNALVSAVGRAPVSKTTTTYTHLQALQQVAGCTGYTTTQCQLAPAGLLTRKVHLSGSDVLGRALTASEISTVAGYLRTWAKTNSTTTLSWEPFGGAMASKAVTDTAFPWRTALGSVQWSVGFSSPPTATVAASTRSWITNGHATFGSASVGAYINYLEPGRPVSAYYGSNYARLGKLRTTYDPHGLFRGTYVIPAA